MTRSRPSERAIVLTPRLLWAFASIAAIISGSLGPWITFAAISLSGTGDGRDGTVTLILGIAAAVLVVIERGRVVVGLLAVAALAIAVIDGSQVLRSREETILGSIEIGWGLVVLALGAASLLVWAITEYTRGVHGSRQVWAFGGIAVALVATTAVLAASGRFDTFDDERDQTGAPEPAAAESKPKETCDGLGINREERNEGDCVDENGWRARVVNDSTDLRLDDITVRVADVAIVGSLRDIAGDPVRPDGRFVNVKLEVRNTTNAPLDVTSGSFILSAGGTVNEPDTDALLDDQLASDRIGPGLSSTGNVVFDVSEKAANAIATDANLLVFQPSDTGAPDEPEQRVGFIRLYTRTEAKPSTAAPAGTATSPDAGVDQTGGASSGATGTFSRQEALQSPSGRIKCAILRNAENDNRVECTMDENPTASGETTWWRLDESGPAVKFRQTIFQGEAHKMPYGDTYYLYGGTPKLQGDNSVLRCKMRETGLVCRNAEHGFRLAAGTHQTF